MIGFLQSALKRHTLSNIMVNGILVVLLLSPAGFSLLLARPVEATAIIPTGLPPHFLLGLGNNSSGLNWMTDSAIPWDARYQYLTGGVNTGNGWATWNSNGTFATNYLNASASAG